MKTMILAAASLLSISIGSAYADGGPIANTFFTELPGVMPQAPVQHAPSAVKANQNGTPTHVYVSHSATGTWLFPPNQNQGANS